MLNWCLSVGNAILCSATKNGEENAPSRSRLDSPLYRPRYARQGSGGNVVCLNINARRAYTAHVGLSAQRHDILFAKNKIYPSPEVLGTLVLDKTEKFKSIGGRSTKRNRKFNGRNRVEI